MPKHDGAEGGVMIDFLRRLAPPRESDSSRAVAALPSRFASESPLRATIAQTRPAQRLDDDEGSLSPDTTSAHAPSSALAAQQVALRPLGDKRARRETGTATSSAHALIGAEARDISAAAPRALDDERDARAERSGAVGPEPRGRAGSLPAGQPLRVSAAPAQPHAALPLSQAILAQRTHQPRDESEVVHVTIGRIDVVANAAPAPAVRRGPKPRQATVTLADYLRGGNGGRR